MAKLAEQLQRMGFSEEQIAGATVDGKPLAELEPKKRTPNLSVYRSKWETLYALELAAAKLAGEISDWQYEGMTFNLTRSYRAGGKTHRGERYTPDFNIWLLDGRLRCVEIKGHRRTKDVNRYKEAREKFPHIEWLMVRKVAGGWEQIG